MKIAIIGSRNLSIYNLNKYIPTNATEIVSGGAKGIDTYAKEFALKHNIKLTEFLPEYNIFGKAAPIRRNHKIVDYSDEVLAFWDGKSKGTKSVIEYCKKTNKQVTVITMI